MRRCIDNWPIRLNEVLFEISFWLVDSERQTGIAEKDRAWFGVCLYALKHKRRNILLG